MTIAAQTGSPPQVGGTETTAPQATPTAPPVHSDARPSATKPTAQKGTTSTAIPAGIAPTEAQTLEAFNGQKISSIELAGRPYLDQKPLLPLFELHAGDPFDIGKAEHTAAAIKQAGKFESVQLSVTPDVEGVRVLLIIHPGLYFGVYEFPGVKGFPYSRLLQVTNYPPLGPYTERDVKNASESLAKFLQQNGYFEVKVNPAIDPDSPHGIVNVHYSVVLGPHARFGAVDLEGASPAETVRLQGLLKSILARLRTSAIRYGKPYSLKTIQNATTYMQNALVKRDRLGAQVKMIGAEYDPETNLAKIRFHIHEGPLVRVRVTGAHVWKSTERKLLPVFQQVGVDNELVQEGRTNLISYFQSKGFFQTKVEASVTRERGGETIQYKIIRGSKHKVASVSIDGNKALSDAQLMPHVAIHKAKYKFLSHGLFSEKLLRASTRDIEATYHAEGFSDVKVTPKVEGQGGNIDVTFLVNEGPRDIVRELKVVGDDTMPLSQLAPKGLKLAAGQPYSQSKADEDRQTISVKYLESGYLTSTFREVVQSEKNNPHSLIVTYEIHEGPKVTISSVITVGRLYTKQRFIDRAARFTLHAPLTTGGMLSAESRLYAAGIFDWAEVSPRRQITTQTREDVLVKVHEARRNTLTYGFGFEVIERGGSLPSGTIAVPGLPPVGVSSSFATSQKTYWGPRGSAEYTRRNIFGMAETLTLGTLDGRLLQRASANFQNPSFRGTAFSSDLNASFEHNSENPIFTDLLELAGFQLQKPLNHKKTENLNLRYSFSVTQITNLLIPDLVPSGDLNVRLSTLSGTFSRDTRDNQLNATRGSLESAEFDLNPQAMGSSVSFTKLLMQVARYKKIPDSIVWANSLRLGFDNAFAGSHVPLSQEFFSGGGSTLRGFPLDGAGPQRQVSLTGSGVTSANEVISVPNGGRQLLIINSEFRIPTPMIYKNLGVAAFYDGGNVFTSIGFHGQYTNTIGGGLRYSTPVGPIRFDIGHNLNAPPGISSTQYFITLGQAF